MKLAFLSDIHSNYDALQVVLAHIKQQKAEKIFCCGDIVGYNAQPNECCDAMQALGAVCVKGNHEDLLLGSRGQEGLSGPAGDAISWQKKIVSKDNKFFLRALPAEVLIDGFSSRMTHASPYEPTNYHYVLSEGATVEAFNSFKEQVCIIGHTHEPIAYRQNIKYKTHEEIYGDEVQIEEGFKYIINVGSVGQPRDNYPKSCVYIYDIQEKVFRRKRLAYDIPSAQKKIREAGLPDYLAERLESGS